MKIDTIDYDQGPSGLVRAVTQPELKNDRAATSLSMKQGLLVATLRQSTIIWTVKVDPETLWDDVAEHEGQLGDLDLHGGPDTPENPMRFNIESTPGTRAVWLTTENACWVLVPEPRIEPFVVRALVTAALLEEIRACSILKEYEKWCVSRHTRRAASAHCLIFPSCQYGLSTGVGKSLPMALAAFTVCMVAVKRLSNGGSGMTSPRSSAKERKTA